MTNDEIAELVEEYGFDDEGVILFSNFDYHTAFIGLVMTVEQYMIII